MHKVPFFLAGKSTTLRNCCIIVIYATSFCVNWAFLIARGTRLKHERSEGFKASAHFALGQLRGSLQRRKMRIYDS
jgi:hypothetical protein